MIKYFILSENPDFSLANITDFNNIAFSGRGNQAEYDHYRFIKNPFASENKNFIYCVLAGNNYVAQMLTMPTPLSLNERLINAFWGQDYYVVEKYRGEGIGKHLSNYYLKNDFYIAVGFSSKSAFIHQEMGAKKIGYLDFYHKWASPLHKIKFLVQRMLKIKPNKIKDYLFPNQVYEFKKLQNVKALHLPNLNWNKDVLETLRNKDYLEWRFFYKKDRYFVYYLPKSSNENSVYFVAKAYFYKGVNWLKIVDYRYNNKIPPDFRNILKAAKKLSKELNLYGIIISSSQVFTREILDINKFKNYRNEVVLTTYPFVHPQTDEPHNHFIITFADSDMDMHTNLGKFNYGEDY